MKAIIDVYWLTRRLSLSDWPSIESLGVLNCKEKIKLRMRIRSLYCVHIRANEIQIPSETYDSAHWAVESEMFNRKRYSDIHCELFTLVLFLCIFHVWTSANKMIFKYNKCFFFFFFFSYTRRNADAAAAADTIVVVRLYISTFHSVYQFLFDFAHIIFLIFCSLWHRQCAPVCVCVLRIY